MTQDILNHMIWLMLGMAVVVFVSLYFVNAGYGQFRSKQWGWSIDNRWAWMLMEAPVFLIMWFIWLCSPLQWHLPQLVLFSLFEQYALI